MAPLQDEAGQSSLSALNIAIGTPPSSQRGSVAVVRSARTRAWNLQAQGRLKEAEALFRQVLSACEETPGGHPDTHTAKADLGDVLQRQGRAVEAVPLLRAAVDAKRADLGETHPVVLEAAGKLSDALVAAEQLDEADAVLKSALATAVAEHGPTREVTLSLEVRKAKLALARSGDGEPLRTATSRIENVLGAAHARLSKVAAAAAIPLPFSPSPSPSPSFVRQEKAQPKLEPKPDDDGGKAAGNALGNAPQFQFLDADAIEAAAMVAPHLAPELAPAAPTGDSEPCEPRVGSPVFLDADAIEEAAFMARHVVAEHAPASQLSA